MRNNRGFTLVELSIVLVIIGLILGMAFKGKDLIDGAKVKNLAAQYNKFVAGFNTYYEKYGCYPGEGYNATAAPALGGVANCGPDAKNGVVDAGNEMVASLRVLQNAGILTSADIQSVFGQPWTIWYGNLNGLTGSWMDLPGVPQQDPRFVCALDRLMDDGTWNGGRMRTDGTDPDYTLADDCWNLTGQTNFHMLLLP